MNKTKLPTSLVAGKQIVGMPIIVENDSSENNNSDENKLYIELTYYPDTLPQIKSYYLMTDEQYRELKTLHVDLYIENFLNNEDLTKDKLDIYVISNVNNIKICKKFLDKYGNPFDILNYIHEKKKRNSLIPNNKDIDDLENKLFKDVSLLNNLFSDENELNDGINKPKLTDDFDTDTNVCDTIDTITDIIDNFNKTKRIDKNMLKNSNIKNDEIINEIINK
jgi:hypothetical protein